MIETGSRKTYVRQEATGVIYLLAPFNFPLWLVFKGGIPNLFLGNSILMRNSDSTPRLAEKIEFLFKEGGYEKNFANVFSSHSQLGRICSNKFISGISFTGSTAAGKIIA